jgi:tetratricopeptide (TPR) repeat protein
MIGRFVFACAGMLALAAGVAEAKGVVVTERDVLACNGTSGSGPEEQVVACTKLLNSGKIKHPHESDFYAMRAGAYFVLKRHSEALADLNKALTFQASPEIYFQRALVYMAMENTDGAKADLAQVIKLKPDFAPSYFMRGLIAYDAGEYSEAVKDFDAAVQRLPTYYQAIYARGVAKTKAGDASGGEKDVKDARGMSQHVESDMEKLGFKL